MVSEAVSPTLVQMGGYRGKGELSVLQILDVKRIDTRVLHHPRYANLDRQTPTPNRELERLYIVGRPVRDLPSFGWSKIYVILDTE